MTLMSVTHRHNAVDDGPCTQSFKNRPLLSLSLVKLASSTSPQKPPTTYTRVNDFGPHTDSISWDYLYARVTYTRVYTVVIKLRKCITIVTISAKYIPNPTYIYVYVLHQYQGHKLICKQMSINTPVNNCTHTQHFK